MKLSAFDYHLPKKLIAQHPTNKRDQSRLLLLPLNHEPLSDNQFSQLPDLLREAGVKLLVLNNTKVIPARLFGKKETGGKVELLLLNPLHDSLTWESMVKTSKHLSEGTSITLSCTNVKTRRRLSNGNYLMEFPSEKAVNEEIRAYGIMPLPPYIKRNEGGSDLQKELDRKRYQTIYAKEKGAIAAPTAGLHFTGEIFSALTKKGIDWVYVTLHVGAGTFAPVRAKNAKDHIMHKESFHISKAASARINQAYKNNEKVLAVGTTSCRALESAIDENGRVRNMSGATDLFIFPGYQFKAIDGLLTNFHLPQSTLMILVSALAGHEKTMAAYNHAVKNEYRFFSYGDSMLMI